MKHFSFLFLQRFSLMNRFALLLLLAFSSQVAYAQVFQWAKGFNEAPFFDYGNSMAADASGNAFYAGAFENTLQIGSFTLNSPGYNMFVAKVDPAGNVAWAKHFPNDSFWEGSIYDLETDAAGNLYVTGSFEDSITIGSIGMAAPFLGPDFFLAKIDPAGNVVWAKQGSGSSNDEAFSLSLDGSGNIYLAGYTYNAPNNFSYDGTLINGQDDGFLLKIDNNGGLVWSKILDGDFFDVAVDASGNGYLSGSFSNTQLDLGNGVTLQHTGPGFYSHFVSRFLANGQFQWANLLGGTQTKPKRVRVAPGGDAMLLGVFEQAFTYGSTSLTGQASRKDLFLLKLDDTGSLAWANSMANLGWDQGWLGFGASPLLEVDPAGNAIVANVHKGTIQPDPTNFHFALHDPTFDIAVVKLSPTGSLVWSERIGGPGWERISGLALSGSNSIFVSGGMEEDQSSPFATQFGSNLSLSTNIEGAFIARMLNEANLFTGRVFLDLNGSGVRDPGEPGLANIPLSVSPGQMLVPTQAGGIYNAYTDAGNFQITVPQTNSYYSLSPATHSASFATLGLVDSANHFALQPIGASEDLQVSLVQLSAARPGFTYRTRIIYHNAGTVALSGTVKMVSDTLLTFDNAIPVIGSTSGDTLQWTFSGLQPFESRQITVAWHVSDSAALGTPLRVVAMVASASGTDLTPADNIAEVTPIITGSYDPNDKLVSHDELTPNQVAGRQPLTYTVRFQNTGTDTAFTVMVRDQFSTLLDMGTLEVISTSHPFSMTMTGPTTIEWKFDNILLPDSNVNEPASHGYIQYRIKPLATLNPGQHINTSAGIYFDFNAPVLTNITDTEITQPSAVPAQHDPVRMQVWPNPAMGSFTVSLDAKATGNMQLRMLNAVGQEVMFRNLGTRSGTIQEMVSLEKLPAGIYLVQVLHNGRAYSRQVVVQR